MAAPSARTASILICGVVRGMTIVARAPRLAAGRARGEPLGGESNALGVIAGGRGDDAALERGAREAGHFIVGAAALERENRLQVLALEPDMIAEAAREHRRVFQRRLARDLVDARIQNPREIILRHGKIPPRERVDYTQARGITKARAIRLLRGGIF